MNESMFRNIGKYKSIYTIMAITIIINEYLTNLYFSRGTLKGIFGNSIFKLWTSD